MCPTLCCQFLAPRVTVYGAESNIPAIKNAELIAEPFPQTAVLICCRTLAETLRPADSCWSRVSNHAQDSTATAAPQSACTE